MYGSAKELGFRAEYANVFLYKTGDWRCSADIVMSGGGAILFLSLSLFLARVFCTCLPPPSLREGLCVR